MSKVTPPAAGGRGQADTVKVKVVVPALPSASVTSTIVDAEGRRPAEPAG